MGRRHALAPGEAGYEDGTLNVSVNCIDRHLAKRGDQTAIIWEGDDPTRDDRITYKQLHERVCKFANVLKANGVKNSHDKLYECADRFFVFMMDNFEPELTVMGARSFMATTRERPFKPTVLPSWKRFTKEYYSLIPALNSAA